MSSTITSKVVPSNQSCINIHRKKMRILLLAITSLLLGCTSPTPLKDAQAAKILFSPVVNKSARNSTIVVVRDSGFSASLLDFSLFFDGRLIGILRPGEKIEFEAIPANYILGVSCLSCRETYRKELQINVLESKSHYFRVMWLDGLVIQPSTQIN